MEVFQVALSNRKMVADKSVNCWNGFWLFSVVMLDVFVFVEEWVQNHDILLFWQVQPAVHVFQVTV